MMLALAVIVALGRYTYLLEQVSLTPFTFGVMLVMFGGGMILLGVLGRRFGAFLAVACVLVFTAWPASALAHQWRWDQYNVGIRVDNVGFEPTDPYEAEAGQHLSAGDLYANLLHRSIVAHRDVTVPIQLDAGRTQIVLPYDIPVVVHANIDIGAISLYGMSSEDWIVETTGGPFKGISYEYDDVYSDGHPYSTEDGSINFTNTDSSDPHSLGEIGGINVDVILRSRVEVSEANPYTLTVDASSWTGQIEFSNDLSWE
jgi:hypothetical protein